MSKVMRSVGMLGAAVVLAALALLAATAPVAEAGTDRWTALADRAYGESVEAVAAADAAGTYVRAQFVASLASCAGRRFGWRDLRTQAWFKRLYSLRTPDGGYGLGAPFDAFGDGTVNPADTAYTITEAWHVGRVLLAGYDGGGVLAGIVRHVAELVAHAPASGRLARHPRAGRGVDRDGRLPAGRHPPHSRGGDRQRDGAARQGLGRLDRARRHLRRRWRKRGRPGPLHRPQQRHRQGPERAASSSSTPAATSRPRPTASAPRSSNASRPSISSPSSTTASSTTSASTTSWPPAPSCPTSSSCRPCRTSTVGTPRATCCATSRPVSRSSTVISGIHRARGSPSR